MLIVYGTRLYGTVDRCGPTRVATKFFHIYGMPILPLGSVLVTEENPETETYRGIAVGLHARSLVAGYARPWLPLMAFIVLFPVMHGWTRASYGGPTTGPLVASLALLGLCAAAIVTWLRLGKLGLEERAQRFVYADFSGIPADVALLGDAREGLRRSLLMHVQERIPALVATGYRLGLDASAGWERVALDPTVRDRQFLGAAVTLARLEWALARRPQRAACAERHTRLWRKLLEIDPAVLEQATII